MFCPKCGAEVAPEAVYCHQCGIRLDEEQPGATGGSAEDERSRHDPDSAAWKNHQPPASTPVERLQHAAAHNSPSDDDDEEEELWVGAYSPKAMLGRWLGSVLVTLVLLIAGLYLPQAWRGWGWSAIVVVVLLMWLYQLAVMLYRQWNVRYRLTTQRFTHEQGILRRTTDRIELIDVDDIAFDQGLLERMMDVGTVRISSSDRSHPELDLIGIDGVRDVAQMIDDARRRERRRRGLHIESI